jgi:hypothetical protein
MFRRLSLAVFALLLAAPLAAQAPAGYMMRIDRSTNAEDPDDRADVTIAAASPPAPPRSSTTRRTR